MVQAWLLYTQLAHWLGTENGACRRVPPGPGVALPQQQGNVASAQSSSQLLKKNHEFAGEYYRPRTLA